MVSLKFIRKIQNIPNVYSFIFEPPKDFNWVAGQFVQITVPHENPDNRGVKRFFSISSAPFEKNVMITTRFETENSSSFKKAFYIMKPETLIESTQAMGEFIVKKQDKKIIFAAGGIGMTPVRSIVMDLDYKNKLNNIDLLYTNRDNNILFKEDLENKQKNNSSFKIHYFINPVFICEETLNKIYDKLPDCRIYISGPPAMVKGITELFSSKGITKDYIRTDYFPGY